MSQRTDVASSASAVVTRAPALVRDQVANFLRGQITSMALPPGALLIERAICEATTASRATVREALRQLESEGLIVSDVGRGTVVASLSRKEAEDMYAVRAKLEGFACRLFAINASDEQVGYLAATVTDIQEAVGDVLQMSRAKNRFYDVLFEGSANLELGRLVEQLRQRFSLLRVNSLSLPGRPQKSAAEIGAILEALRNRDPERAEELCIVHIESAAKNMLAAPEAYFRK